MALKKRSPQSQNSDKEKKEQKVVLLEEWFNFNTYEKDFMTNTKLERLAQELIIWARDTHDAIKVKEFLGNKGIDERTWTRWCDTFPALKDAHNHAKMLIGNRREKGILHRKLDGNWTAFMMPHYDRDWQEQLQNRAELKQKDETDGGTKIVVMTATPDCPDVPEKGKKKGK